MFSKKLAIVLMVASCMLFTASMSALAAEADDLTGTWTVHVKWVSPEIVGEYELYVTMNNPFIGTFTTAGGNSGPIINIIIYVRWVMQSSDVLPIYQGLVFGGFGFGKMENNAGNSGTWWALKEAAGAAADPGAEAGVQ